ncbi:hypothetical protein JCM19237_1712 [Photobacterium aphoticum]|uniref:Uncharacterized protein n=1 Tax=Photobacterium aphoticum TaxID=754436 RepID=A0A090REU6_9GAMM|nr:hypothetical protein JCM19237_1712 [Photobacterium aphoticum]
MQFHFDLQTGRAILALGHDVKGIVKVILVVNRNEAINQPL